MKLHVVMPVSRPQFVPSIIDFYLNKVEPHPFDFRFHLLVQGKENDPKGTIKTDEGIDQCHDGWIQLVADDTFQHPSLYRRLGEIIDANPAAGCVVFAENRGDRIVHPSVEDTKTGHICGGMYLYERAFLADERYGNDEPTHRCDGRMVARLYAKDPSRFVFVDEILTMENSFFW